MFAATVPATAAFAAVVPAAAAATAAPTDAAAAATAAAARSSATPAPTHAPADAAAAAAHTTGTLRLPPRSQRVLQRGDHLLYLPGRPVVVDVCVTHPATVGCACRALGRAGFQGRLCWGHGVPDLQVLHVGHCALSGEWCYCWLGVYVWHSGQWMVMGVTSVWIVWLFGCVVLSIAWVDL